MAISAACAGGADPDESSAGEAAEDTTAGQDADWPTDTIRWVMTAPPGGGQDGASRPLQPYLEEQLGESVVIDNRPGGDFTVGASIVAREGGDCQTIMTHVDPMIHMGMMLHDVDYDSETFYPILGLTEDPMVMLAHKDSEWNNAAELIEDAKDRPGEIQFGTALGADPALFSTYQLQEQAGVEFNLIPYPGGGPARNALVAGEIDVLMTFLYTALPFSDGTKILGINQLEGLAAEENPWGDTSVATLNEQLGTELDPYSLGFSFWATNECREQHPERFEVLQDAFASAVEDPEWQADMEELGQTEALQIRGPEEHMEWSLEQRENIEPLMEQYSAE